MGKSREKGISLAETRAGDFYRRFGFNEITTRPKPRIRNRTNLVQIQGDELELEQTVELTVYPELTIRKDPWVFWGRVTDITGTGITLKQIGGPDSGTPVFIPYRYFDDKRVYRWAGIEDSEAVAG
jgi:hypothetical protein